MKKVKRQLVVEGGTAVAVILAIDDYQEMLERLEDLHDLKMLQEMKKKPLRFRKLEDFLTERPPAELACPGSVAVGPRVSVYLVRLSHSEFQVAPRRALEAADALGAVHLGDGVYLDRAIPRAQAAVVAVLLGQPYPEKRDPVEEGENCTERTQ
jgi:hypothetical protein